MSGHLIRPPLGKVVRGALESPTHDISYETDEML